MSNKRTHYSQYPCWSVSTLYSVVIAVSSRWKRVMRGKSILHLVLLSIITKYATGSPDISVEVNKVSSVFCVFATRRCTWLYLHGEHLGSPLDYVHRLERSALGLLTRQNRLLAERLCQGRSQVQAVSFCSVARKCRECKYIHIYTLRFILLHAFCYWCPFKIYLPGIK